MLCRGMPGLWSLLLLQLLFTLGLLSGEAADATEQKKCSDYPSVDVISVLDEERRWLLPSLFATVRDSSYPRELLRVTIVETAIEPYTQVS